MHNIDKNTWDKVEKAFLNSYTKESPKTESSKEAFFLLQNAE